MSWLTLNYHPGFSHDLTSWTTTIERKGKLRQRVKLWPQHQTIELRARLSLDQIAELERLIGRLDFESLSDPYKCRCAIEDVGFVSLAVKSPEGVQEFSVPLLFWAWSRAQGNNEYLPAFDFAPALEFWEAINRLSPHRL